MLDAEDVLRWTLASQAVRKYGLLDVQKDKPYVIPHSPMLLIDSDIKGIRGLYISLLFISLFAIYGSTHLLGWDAPFPNTTEKLLWRCSAIYIASFPLLGLVIACFTDWIIDHARHSILWRSTTLSAQVALISLPVLYAVASSCILVESFIQLWYLDPKAYLLPTFSNYFPHFS